MKKILALLVISVLLAACGTSGQGDPASVVEKYMQAKVDGDFDIIGSLLCAAMEANIEREGRTFESVSDVRIEDMSCQRVAESETVSCEGKIVALYGAEETEFPLVSFRVVQEDGEWKWCGEASTP